MRVFTVDPTPRAARHVRQVLDGAVRGESVPINNSQVEHYDFSGFEPSRLRLLEVGLSDTNSVLRFWAPKDPAHVSHSIVNLQHTGEFFEAQCIRLQDLCAANGVDEIEILKIDVEGAEYAVLKDLTAGQLRPRVVCVEFDEGPILQDKSSLQRISDTVQEMKQVGYRLLKIEHWNFMFCLHKD
jgi:FkbM family methyltransferase